MKMFLFYFFAIFEICLIHVICGESIYNFKVEDYEGKEVSLEKYHGKVTLIVNVASNCGYTESMYRAITRIHDILSYDGYFSVLAFPCNQFGEQEPNEAPLIFANMQEQYFIEFPFFNKINVKGPSASPLFRELVEQSATAPDWNFYKYLVDHTGHVIKAWSTPTTVEEIFDDVQKAIEAAKKFAKSKKEETGGDSTSETENTATEEEGAKEEL